MATIIPTRVHPDLSQHHRAPSRPRSAGIAIAKAFDGLMAMSMMALVVGVAIHFSTAAGLTAATISPAATETTAITLDAVRRLGVAGYLVAVALGLATIVEVIRFQTIRLHELAGVTRH
ncbi:MAG: hypothetical protein ACFCVC_16330 [Acidimicrobiia bacterium]